MSLDMETLRERFGAASVAPWQPAGPAYAGLLPEGTPVVSPGSVEELQECLRIAAAGAWRVLPAGAMEHLGFGATPAPVDIVVSTRRLHQLLAYEPGDLTLVAQAGVTLREIERLTAVHGQEVAPAPWPGAAATLGGACAANRAGLNRLGAGTWRDAVLGCRVVHADGGLTKSGGNVVKNVTGYDLPKLYVGSCGSLAVLAEINLRLRPRAEAISLVVASAALDAAAAHLLDVHRGRWQPSALLAVAGSSQAELPGVEGQVQILARFAGFEPVVRQQARECAALWKGEVVAAERQRAVWDELQRLAEPGDDRVVLSVAVLPVGVLTILAIVRAVCGDAAESVAEFGVGTATVRLGRRGFPVLPALQARLRAEGATVRCLHAPPDVRRQVQPVLPPAPALQAAIKRVHDPESRLRDVPFQLPQGAP